MQCIYTTKPKCDAFFLVHSKINSYFDNQHSTACTDNNLMAATKMINNKIKRKQLKLQIIKTGHLVDLTEQRHRMKCVSVLSESLLTWDELSVFYLEVYNTMQCSMILYLQNDTFNMMNATIRYDIIQCLRYNTIHWYSTVQLNILHWWSRLKLCELYSPVSLWFPL